MNYDENNNVFDEVSDQIETINFAEPIVDDIKTELSANFNVNNQISNDESLLSQDSSDIDMQSQMLSPFEKISSQTDDNLFEKDNENDSNIDNYNVEKGNSNQETLLNQDSSDIDMQSQMLSLDDDNNLQTNDILDNNFSNDVKQEQLGIETQEKGDTGFGFIIFLFIILVAFIIALPHITKII